jgi:hypothetical protein
MKKLTPEEYVLQYACVFVKAEQELESAPPEEMKLKISNRTHAVQQLRTSVEIYMKNKPF